MFASAPAAVDKDALFLVMENGRGGQPTLREVVFDPTIARQNLRPSGTDRALNLRERLLASCLVAGLICRARSGHSFPDNLCLLW
jgi:hypothetical protein